MTTLPGTIASRIRVLFRGTAGSLQRRRQAFCIAAGIGQRAGEKLKSRTNLMTAIENTALGRLEKEGRLLNAVLKGETTKPGRFGFRGDIALKFQTQVADEKRPPDYSIEQVLTVAQDGEGTIPVLAGYLHSFAYLADVAAVLDGALSPQGSYFLFCNNIDLLAKYQTKLGGITFHVLPCDESTVWKEMMDLVGLNKDDLKKLDAGGKLDYLLEAAKTLDLSYDEISYEDGLTKMEPVKNRNENRPV
ncbi:hypothetical protein ACVIHD_007062 [Bradyrhizobium embrapense]